MLEVLISVFISAIISLCVSISFEVYNVKVKEVSSKFKELKEDACYCLTMYACYYLNPFDFKDCDTELKNTYKKVSYDLRDIGSRFGAFAESNKILSRLLKIPAKAKLIEISANFIGLSNNLFTPYGSEKFYRCIEINENRANRIKSLLDIEQELKKKEED